MPAPSLCVPFAVSAMELHGRDGAFRLVIQDESGEEEAAREEVDTKNVEQAERRISDASLASGWRRELLQDQRQKSDQKAMREPKLRLSALVLCRHLSLLLCCVYAIVHRSLPSIDNLSGQCPISRYDGSIVHGEKVG